MPDVQDVEVFLDGDRMRAVMEDRLPWWSGGRFVIRNCVVDSVRCNSRLKDRNRRRPLLCVCYRLEVFDTRGQGSTEQFLYAEVHPAAWSRPAAGAGNGSSGIEPRSGRAVVHLPGATAIVWAFPSDPCLRDLPEVMDPDSVKFHLPYDRLPAGLDGPADVRDCRVEVLRYKPETHCAARYRVTWGAAADPQALTLFGKTFAGECAGDVSRQMEAVWRKSLADPHSFRIGTPMGHARSVRTVWQGIVSGASLLTFIAEGDCDGLLREAGAGLAVLHETPPVTTLRVGVADQLAEMQRQIAALIEAFPRVRRILEPIEARLRERGSTLRPLAETLVHGDFIAKNLLLQDGRLVVCDFDDCVLGDPVQDVARFLVDLRFLEDRDSHVVNLRPCDPARVESMAAVFTQAYRARARWPVSDEHLAWHRQVQLIAKIHYYYKRQQFRPGFERDLDDMLALLSGPA
jgi:hypothetical protein